MNALVLFYFFLHSFKCEPLCQRGERQDTLQHSKNAYRFIVLVWLASLGLVNSVESDGLTYKPEVMWNNFQPVHSYFFLTYLYVPGVFWFKGWTLSKTQDQYLQNLCVYSKTLHKNDVRNVFCKGEVHVSTTPQY